MMDFMKNSYHATREQACMPVGSVGCEGCAGIVVMQHDDEFIPGYALLDGVFLVTFVNFCIIFYTIMDIYSIGVV